MREETYEEFLKNLKKVSESRTHRISGSSGMAAAYTYYRQHRPKEREYTLQRSQYDKIVNDMNLLAIDSLFENKSFKLPFGIGVLYIDKVKSKTFIDENDKLVCTRPINVDATFRLWYEDQDSFESRTKVRYESDYAFRLKYGKRRSTVKNSIYFVFKYGRDVKQKLKNIIETDKTFDTYEFKQMDEH